LGRWGMRTHSLLPEAYLADYGTRMLGPPNRLEMNTFIGGAGVSCKNSVSTENASHPL
jgi:hypothetical protein